LSKPRIGVPMGIPLARANSSAEGKKLTHLKGGEKSKNEWLGPGQGGGRKASLFGGTNSLKLMRGQKVPDRKRKKKIAS